MSSQIFSQILLPLEIPIINQSRVDSMNDRIFHCGKWVREDIYCHVEKEHLIKSKVKQFRCGIRYCSKSDCLVERFATTLESFKSIPRLHGLKNLWHTTIGFPLVSFEDFKNNYSSIKKRHEIIIGSFIKKCKKRGIDLKGIRANDFSFTKSDQGLLYVHYHFGMIPLQSKFRSQHMTTIKKIESSMNQNMKIKTPFHFQSHGIRNKESMFCYLAKRSIGLYKFDESTNHDWATGKGRLKKDIENGVYFTLDKILTPEQYVNHFYQRRHYVTFGGIPHGSILTDNSYNEEAVFCKDHGYLDRFDYRKEITFDVKPPDDNSPQNIMLNGKVILEVTKI